MNFFNLVILFYSFSFIGWLMEVILTIIEDGKLINRGFLIGPICPIYGFGVLGIVTFVSKYADDIPTFFILSVFVCSFVEYFTSWLMEKLFKNRWWDYSEKKFNINGRICLEYAIPFGLFGCLAYYIIIPFFQGIFVTIPIGVITTVSYILLGLTFIDICISFKIIIKLKNISSSIRCDSTEAITKKVKETLLSKNHLYQRLVASFPNMKVFNKMAIFKEKININKLNLKKEKKKK